MDARYQYLPRANFTELKLAKQQFQAFEAHRKTRTKKGEPLYADDNASLFRNRAQHKQWIMEANEVHFRELAKLLFCSLPGFCRWWILCIFRTKNCMTRNVWLSIWEKNVARRVLLLGWNQITALLGDWTHVPCCHAISAATDLNVKIPDLVVDWATSNVNNNVFYS